MFGLPQAGRIANDQLVAFLKPHGYTPCPLTHGLWRHHTRDIVFSLIVDNFGVRYTNRSDADHQLDYTNRTCGMSMPGCIDRALQRFNMFLQQNPSTLPTRGNAPTLAPKPNSPALSPTPPLHLTLPTKNSILKVLGTLLFYARAIDFTMLTVIREFATEQTQATKTTMDKQAHPIAKLLRCSPGHHHPVHRQRHDSCRRKRLLVSLCCQRTVSSGSVFLLHQQDHLALRSV